MKLIRFGERGAEKPGVLIGGQRKDCSKEFSDWDAKFWRTGGPDALAALLGERGGTFPDVPGAARWAPCVARPGKVIAIGLNYADHAAETGVKVPEEPVVFMKAASAITGPYDPLQIPRGSTKTDWEVELAVVIGRDARYLASESAAASVIAGYCACNDVSERAFQMEHCGQWTKGKSCDSFCPLGPWLATPDEIPDAQNLALTLDVNGEHMQNGNTRTMVRSVRFIVHYLTQFMTLEAGDVITTGTPPGVGMGRKPPRFLKEGDVVELAVEGLGQQRMVCRSAD